MRSSTWSALGNTYLVVERDDGPPLAAEAVRGLCRDADGVVEVVAAGAEEIEVVIWNRDGSVAEMSGNGMRIAARWLSTRSGAEVVRIRGGEREVVARMLGRAEVETDMGAVQVGEREEVEGIPLVRVSVGNPHVVVEGDPNEIVRIGPLLVGHPRFPHGTNVEVARVERAGEVTARVWERGVGETLSSGTGAIAVAAATHRHGRIIVHFPGGDLEVRLEGDRAYLRGPADRVE